mmetsp:Transcript_2583/g.9887  ORF Transcript_2583/g.9887 Transcript_2583/m.9887 type:complete len:1019 (-) Transcript_2583:192-3248(-)
MFSPAIGDDSLFSIVTKNSPPSSSTPHNKLSPHHLSNNSIQTFHNVSKLSLSRRRFLIGGKYKQNVSLQLNEKSIYEIAPKSLKVLKLIPYESIRDIEAKSKQSFVLDGSEYVSDVALQIVAEIKKRRRDIMERRESVTHRMLADGGTSPPSKDGLSIRRVTENADENIERNGSSVDSMASTASSSPQNQGLATTVTAALANCESSSLQTETSHSNTHLTGDIPDDFMFHSDGAINDSSAPDTTHSNPETPSSPLSGSFRSSKKDKLAKIFGITKDERLNLEADKIILDHSTDEGRTCLQFARDFHTQFGCGDKIAKNACKETRTFLDKMKRYIVTKRGENFEALLGSSVASGSAPSFLTQHMAAEIDAETREKNDAIEKSLERALLTDSIRKSLLNSFNVADPSLKQREAAFEEKMRKFFSKASQDYFHIPSDIQSPTEWRSCAHDLYKLNYAQYPFEMVQIILDTSRKVYALFKEEHPDNASAVLAADDVLPLMIFIITRADVKQPLQMMEYITSLMDPIIMSQEEGYYCTLYNSALSVLEGMNVEGDNEEENEGKESVDEANESVSKVSNDSSDIPPGADQPVATCTKNRSRSSSVDSLASTLGNSSGEQPKYSSPQHPGTTLPIPCIEKIRYFTSKSSKETVFTQSYFPQTSQNARARVFCIHGVHEHSGRNVELHTRLIKGNMIVHTMDLVGHGYSGGLRGYMDSMEAFIDDLIQFAEMVQKEDIEFEHLPTYAIGYGMAASLILGASTERPSLFSGCCFICPTFFPNRNYSAFLQSISRLVEVLAPKKPLVDFVISTDEKVQQEFEKDPMVVRGKVLVKTACGILRFQNKIATLIPKFQAPFLFLRAKKDHICDPQKDDQMYDLLQIEDKELRVFDACHALLHNSHKTQVVEEICRWLNSRVSIHTGDMARDRSSSNSSVQQANEIGVPVAEGATSLESTENATGGGEEIDSAEEESPQQIVDLNDNEAHDRNALSEQAAHLHEQNQSDSPTSEMEHPPNTDADSSDEEAKR